MVCLPLFCTVFLLFTSVLPALSLNNELLALLAFKQSIQQDPEDSLSNWNPSDENPCSWSGITCQDFKVISISIPQKRLLGILPSVLGSLSNLTNVNLRGNKLHGSLSAELFDASSIHSFVDDGSTLHGSVPSDVGKLKYLQTLDLSDNFFSGSIPNSVLQCRRLKMLDLSRNNFTGPLPVGFGTSLIALENLNLSYNQLSGSVPGDFGHLSSLQGTVDLSHNLFSGKIPAGLGKLPEKVYIDLTYNNLSGPIPQSGELVNRGPTAFIGNPGLCGPPLKSLCSSDQSAGIAVTLPFIPPNNQLPTISDDNNIVSSGKGGRNLSGAAVVAIIVSDIIGIILIALVFLSCYWRKVHRNGKDEGGNSGMAQKGQLKFLCSGKEESETISENVEPFNLVPFDSHVGFDLDELLKSSAFVLGKSKIGIVYRVLLDDRRTLAVRRLGGGMQRFKEFCMEAEAIGKVRHPNIVTLRAYYWSPDQKLLVYDYIPNGDLSAAIHGKGGTIPCSPMPWLVRLKIMSGIAKGLAYLHEFSPRKYIHGELKPTNILLGPNMEPYISDFGLRRLANIAGECPAPHSNRIAAEEQQNQPSEVSMKQPASPGSCYQAPEALRVIKPSQKWDVYSFGVILLELISGRSPVVLLGTSDMNLVTWVRINIEEKKPLSDVLDPCLRGEPDRQEAILSVLKMALACVQTNAERRPSMRHVSETLEKLSTNS